MALAGPCSPPPPPQNPPVRTHLPPPGRPLSARAGRGTCMLRLSAAVTCPRPAAPSLRALRVADTRARWLRLPACTASGPPWRAAMPSRRRYASRYIGPAPVAAAGPATRAVVAVLGGYRHLYCLCLGPALDRLAQAHHLPLTLALLPRLLEAPWQRETQRRAGVPGRQQQPSSPLFLCKPVDVL